MVLGLTAVAGASGLAAAQDTRAIQGLNQTNQPPGLGGLGGLSGLGGIEGFHEKGAASTAKNVVGGVLGVAGATLWMAVMLAIFVIDVGMSILPAILAARCNPKHPFLMGLVGFFFSEIYMFQYLLRKLVLKQKGYCQAV